jgi:hypothetical protein
MCTQARDKLLEALRVRRELGTEDITIESVAESFGCGIFSERSVNIQ